MSETLDALRWFRVRCMLRCTAEPPGGRRVPAYRVMESVRKGVARAEGAPPPDFFHVRGRGMGYAPARGDRVPVEFFFCTAPPGAAGAWRAGLERWFGPGGGGRNFEIADLGPVEERSYAALAGEVGALPAEGEVCLEFLMPVPFRPAPGKPREHLDAPGLVGLLAARVRRLFGMEPPARGAHEGLRVLCHFWRYASRSHASESQPGEVQWVKGCAGRLYLRGRLQGVAPLVVLCSELHAGTKLSNGQGYYRVLPSAPPYFAASVASPQGLAAACRDVLARHDGAAAQLMQEPGERFDEEAFAAALAEELRSGAYRPAPHVAFCVARPDGSERLVERPAYRDMVVYRHLLRVLAPSLDRLFEEGSVGFRKGRSRHRAARMVERALDEGFRYVVESDIEDFFPSVDLERLEGLLDACLPRADTLLRRVLHAVLWNGYVLNGVFHPRTRGLAQGSPLSPLLANLYLDAFDEALQAAGVRLVRYADDFVVLTRTRQEAERILLEAGACLQDMGLALNRAKTAVRDVGEGFEFLGVRFGADGARVLPEDASASRRLRKPLYVTEPYVFLALDGEALEVRRRGEVVQSLPLRRLSEVMVLGTAVFSTALVARCVRMKIPFVIGSGNGYHMATVRPDSKRHYEVAHRHAQRFEALSDTERLAIAKGFAAGKLRNYAAWFRRARVEGGAADAAELEAAADRIGGAGDLDAVRGLEGAAARRVYAWIARAVKHEPFRLARREPRRRADRMNALLDLGYYLLFTRVNATLRAVGLNPYLGFLHSHRDNYESLACDVQELFRPRIDRLMVRLVNLGVVRAGDFVQSDRGWHLKREAVRRVILQFEAEMGRRAGGDRLSLEEVLYRQVEAVRDWALGRSGLGFYGWEPA